MVEVGVGFENVERGFLGGVSFCSSWFLSFRVYSRFCGLWDISILVFFREKK